MNSCAFFHFVTRFGSLPVVWRSSVTDISNVKVTFCLLISCFHVRLVEGIQLELSASNTVKVDYRLPVTCSDFNSTTVNSLGLDFIDLLPVTLSISYRCLNVVSNTDFYAICSHYYHFSNRIVTNIILL